MHWLESLAARIDALTLRERAFVIAGVLAVTYFLWTGFLVQPMERQRLAATTQQQQVSAEIAALSAEAQALLLQVKSDPNAVYRAELDAMKKELAQLDSTLAGTTNHLVRPGQMAAVLEAVLRGTDGLLLRSMESLGASPLVPEAKVTAAGPAAPSAADPEAIPKVYKHGLRMTLHGNFFSVLEFMRKLEAMEWKFFWDAIEFRVMDYPDAVVEITFYTISMDSTWIGA